MGFRCGDVTTRQYYTPNLNIHNKIKIEQRSRRIRLPCVYLGCQTGYQAVLLREAQLKRSRIREDTVSVTSRTTMRIRRKENRVHTSITSQLGALRGLRHCPRSRDNVIVPNQRPTSPSHIRDPTSMPRSGASSVRLQ